MNQITLEWQEGRHLRREILREGQQSISPGTVRLGRDPRQSDLVLSDPTVSGLHVEIFFDLEKQSFALRNLRYSNPPVVDGRQIPHGEVVLRQGSTIYLGQVELKVVAVAIATPKPSIVPTMLMPPLVAKKPHQLPPDVVSYGLECPNCHRVSPYERMDFGCPWCGVSLAAAISVLMTPQGK